VRPAPRPTLPLHGVGGPPVPEGGPGAAAADGGPDAPPPPRSVPGAPNTLLAVPVHDIIDDEAPVDGVLVWEAAHGRAPR